MSDPAARMRVAADGSTVTVTLVGEIDLANADGIDAALQDAITNDVETAVVDLSSVAYIDSIGMRLLFGLATRLQVSQIAFVVIAPVGSPARRVIELAGLASAVALDPS